ncbi:DNA damage checkpoint protein 1, partial [Striga asiatica]
EINPSTYSFTNALKALQARRVYSNTWEYVSADNGGLTLNSKWNDAEKYICNPVSGQVPLQCLSSKALSERSSQSLVTSRTKQEKKRSTTRNVGTQIKFSSESPIPSQIPSCEEISVKPSEQEESRESLVTSKIQKSEAKLVQKVDEKETEDKRNEKKKRENTCCHGGKEKGCLSFINVWRHKIRNQNNNANLSIFLCHVNASSHQ